LDNRAKAKASEVIRVRKTVKKPVSRSRKGLFKKDVAAYESHKAGVVAKDHNFIVAIDQTESGYSSVVIVKAFGCVACPWSGTGLCPHKDDVLRDGAHCNGICGERIRYIKEIKKYYLEASGKNSMSSQKLILLVQLSDDKLWSDRMMQDLVERGAKSVWSASQVLNWRKYIADHLSQHVKHEEGSKVQVSTNSISPSQFQSMVSNIDEDKIVDAEFEEITDLEDGQD
jgi:hypothetical protein